MTASGGGSVINSILSSNTGGPANRQNIYKDGTGTGLTVSYSLIGDYSAGATNNYTSGAGIITGDPAFINPVAPAGADGIFRTGDDGLRISCASPALNTGNGTTPATDILGNARVGTIDMGAYEYQGTGCPAVVYVDSYRPDNNGNGTSWATAKRDIQEAINDAGAGGQVWVKSDVYLPTMAPNGNPNPADPRDKTFYITTKDIKIYGGFSGNETQLSQRNPANNVTILSGDLDGTGGVNDAYHVLTTLNRTAACIVDGFTMSGGRANGSSNFTATGINLARTYGGGMYNELSSPSVSNCAFSNNTASSGGGGVANNGSSVISSCTFSGNTTVSNGGGMFDNSSTVVTNCTFSGNTAGITGGGIYRVGSSSGSITNCILYGNSGSTANQQNLCKAAGTGTLTVSSSLIGDYSVTATNNYTAINILTTDPRFVNINSPAGADGKFMTADDGTGATPMQFRHQCRDHPQPGYSQRHPEQQPFWSLRYGGL